MNIGGGRDNHVSGKAVGGRAVKLEEWNHLAMSYDVVPRQGLTPYASGGNWPVILLTLLIVAAAEWRLRAS